MHLLFIDCNKQRWTALLGKTYSFRFFWRFAIHIYYLGLEWDLAFRSLYVIPWVHGTRQWSSAYWTSSIDDVCSFVKEILITCSTPLIHWLLYDLLISSGWVEVCVKMFWCFGIWLDGLILSNATTFPAPQQFKWWFRSASLDFIWSQFLYLILLII